MNVIARGLAALTLVIASASLHAAARAWLQPDRIALGETTTLNVESDTSATAPDFSVLARDFVLHGQSNSSQTSISSAGHVTRILFAVELQPRAAGAITIPALNVGNEQTTPIVLNVEASAPASAGRNELLYFATELGTHEPYVQQAVLYTVRLYYALSLINGNVDVPAPDAASLQQLGEDKNYQQMINSQRYNVFERIYLLVPEKSGALILPAPQFRGRARSNRMDAFFDGGQGVSAAGRDETLNVRPQPSAATTPWLPASNLNLTRAEPSANARSGEPLLLELTLTADGAMASQLPELLLPNVAGAQVFPEPPQNKDSIVDGQPQATLTRRFAIVPAQPGTLTIPELRVGFWNTRTDQADAAVLPALNVEVALGVGTPIAPMANNNPAIGVTSASASATTMDSAAAQRWQWIAAALALALAASLWWGWRRGNAPRASVATPNTSDKPSPVSPVALQRALAGTNLRAIAEALRQSTTPASSSLGAVQSMLSDARQQHAISTLERTLWAADLDSNDHAATLTHLREAFRDGPRFADAGASTHNNSLPPLYPRR